MKILDEKGKLFGKINIIDLLVILLVVAVAAVAAVRLLPKAQEPAPSDAETETTPITYQLRLTGVDPLTYESVRAFVDPEAGKKDQLFSSDSGNKFLDAYVVDCVATPHVEYVKTDDGQIKRVESSGEDKRLDLLFTVEANVTSTITNKVGRQQVRTGISQVLKTTHFEFSCVVVAVQWPEENNA